MQHITRIIEQLVPNTIGINKIMYHRMYQYGTNKSLIQLTQDHFNLCSTQMIEIHNTYISIKSCIIENTNMTQIKSHGKQRILGNTQNTFCTITPRTIVLYTISFCLIICHKVCTTQSLLPYQYRALWMAFLNNTYLAWLTVSLDGLGLD